MLTIFLNYLTQRHGATKGRACQESIPDFVIFVASCETEKVKPQMNGDGWVTLGRNTNQSTPRRGVAERKQGCASLQTPAALHESPGFDDGVDGHRSRGKSEVTCAAPG